MSEWGVSKAEKKALDKERLEREAKAKKPWWRRRKGSK